MVNGAAVGTGNIGGIVKFYADKLFVAGCMKVAAGTDETYRASNDPSAVCCEQDEELHARAVDKARRGGSFLHCRGSEDNLRFGVKTWRN